MNEPVRLAVLLSGGGTTLQNLLDRIAAGTLPAEVAVVVSSRADARGVERARSAGVPVLVVARKQHASADEFADALHTALEPYDVDLGILAGFLSRFPPRD